MFYLLTENIWHCDTKVLSLYIQFKTKDMLTIGFIEEVKTELSKLYIGTVYDKTKLINQRVDQMLTLHKVWLLVAVSLYSANTIAKKLFISDKSLT